MSSRLFFVIKVLSVSYVGLLLASTVRCALSPSPEDKLSVVGEQVTIPCGTSLPGKFVVWFYVPLDSDAAVVLYKGGQVDVFIPHRSGMFKIDTTLGNGRYDLVLKAVSLDQAGRYFCRDDGGFSSEAASAELIVLEDWSPNCTAKYDDCYRQAGSRLTVSLVCHSLYAGNGNFQMLWYNQTSSTIDHIVIESNFEKSRKIYDSGFVNITWQTSLVINRTSSAAQYNHSLTAVISYRPGKSFSYNYSFTLPVPAPIEVHVNETESGLYFIDDVIVCSAVGQSTDVKLAWVQQGDCNQKTNNSVMALDSEGEWNFTCIARMGSNCISVDVRAIVSGRVVYFSLKPVTKVVMLTFLISLAVLCLFIPLAAYFYRKQRFAFLKHRPNSSLIDCPVLVPCGQQSSDNNEGNFNSSQTNYDDENVYDVPDDGSCPEFSQENETNADGSSERFLPGTQLEIMSKFTTDIKDSNYEKLFRHSST